MYPIFNPLEPKDRYMQWAVWSHIKCCHKHAKYWQPFTFPAFAEYTLHLISAPRVNYINLFIKSTSLFDCCLAYTVGGAGWQIAWRYGHDWPLHCNHFIVYPAPVSNFSPQIVQHFKCSLLIIIWLQKVKFQETKHASTETCHIGRVSCFHFLHVIVQG